MATKFCPQCGDEFVATVETCPDCDLPLVDERPEGVDETKKGHVSYELHEWAGESRVMLESLLTGQDIPHAWEGTDLTVPAPLEARVDGLIAQVEITAEPNLDPDAPKVAYELGDWDDEQQTELIQALDAKGVPYDFDVDGSLVILEADESVVEAVFDELTEAEAGEDGASEDAGEGAGADEDGAADTGRGRAPVGDVELTASGDEDEGEDLDAQAVMSDLFVAADRLRRKAADHQGILTLVDRANDAERMRLPFGFNRGDWREIVSQATALRDLIEDDGSADEDIQARAEILRGTLRSYV